MPKSKRVPITQDQFDALAEQASECKGLAERPSKHGKEYGVWLNGHLMAKSTPNEDGDYISIMYM